MTELEQRQRKARRTAFLLGVVVVGIYAAFWLSGVLGR